MNRNIIGIYHLLEANRKALIHELKMDVDFEFEEISDWKQIAEVKSELVIIFSPQFLPKDVSLEEFKGFLEGVNKTLILVAYQVKLWGMDRTKTFYLERPDKKETMDQLKSILVIEAFGKKRNSRLISEG